MPVHPNFLPALRSLTARRRSTRFAGCLVAAWVFLGPGAANAVGSAAPTAATAMINAADQDCLRTAPPASRSAARGTMPARLRRREAAR